MCGSPPRICVSITSWSESNSIFVFSNVASQTVLTAQIKIAKIQKIEIFSRFRLVNTRDRAHLEVRAYDEEGNVFSSLDGFRFKWDVESGSENILRVPLRDSSH